MTNRLPFFTVLVLALSFYLVCDARTKSDDPAEVVHEVPAEKVKDALSVVLEDSQNHKQIIIPPTLPPKSHIKKDNLAAKAAFSISKHVAEHLVIHSSEAILEAGEQIASGATAGAIGALKVFYSTNKKRAAIKALPTIGIALIPGVGLPLAVGLGMASSFAVDKVYTKVEVKDRILELQGFWPSGMEFSDVKGSLEDWIKLNNQIAHDGRDSAYKESAQELTEVIQWFIRSLSRLREQLLLDWQWPRMNTETFAKNIKELRKGLEVSSTEIEEIYEVIQEGTANFNDMVKNGEKVKEKLNASLQRLNEYAADLKTFKSSLEASIKEAEKYLKKEDKKLR